MRQKNWYYCSKCNTITQRRSDKKTIKSVCGSTDEDSVLTKIESADKLAVKLRKKFLKNMIELNSFTPKERRFLYLAFEQGVMVTFNGLK